MEHNKKRGRPVGSGCILSPALKLEIRKIITNNKPYHLGLIHPFWSASILQIYLMYDRGIRISEKTCSTFIKDCGLTTQRRARAWELVECLLMEQYNNSAFVKSLLHKLKRNEDKQKKERRKALKKRKAALKVYEDYLQRKYQSTSFSAPFL